MNAIKKICSKVLACGILLIGVGAVQAQESTPVYATGTRNSSGSSPLQALKIEPGFSISLDGKLDESIWLRSPIATDFIQRSPNDGESATEKTEARIIYTEDAIYVGIIAYDSAMDSVAATLFRKDGSAYSDWVYVNIDSYNDNRTSFSFAVNPKGVRKDIITFDDNNEDIRWDAVWEAKTEMYSDKWSVEIRIPLSQLRFSTQQTEQEWGINFQRRIARKEEISFWSPTPQDASGFVSQYGTLKGLENLDRPRRLELIPYASSSLTRAPLEEGNPFYESNELAGSLGGDLKYGLTSDLTLTATINPDFGQVEADPAVINLSAFETFFPEQRPFFLEGNDIFQFGNTKTFNSYGNPNTFYTRRIGRAPQGNLNSYNSYNAQTVFNPADVESRYTDFPDQTTIAAAAKVSGKTRNGWSVGFLDAYTVKERSSYFVETVNGSGIQEGTFTVEPQTNYLVARAKKDIDEGNTIFGGFASATNRNIGNYYFENFLHSSAYLGGIDFEHNWDDRNWAVSGTFSASRVNGSSEALLKTQQSPVRYYNRVDSDKLSVDPDKTSLSGIATEMSIQKSGGENWRTSVTYSQVSPGYETNDLGFQNRADYRALSTALMYREASPKNFRFLNLWTHQTWAWNYDGDLIGNYYNLGGYLQFDNLWWVNGNLNFTGKLYMDRLTRGGPVAERPKDWNFNFNFGSDQTKMVSFNFGSYNRWEFPLEGVTQEYDHFVWAGIRIRPATNIQLEIEPEIGFDRDSDQYVTRVEDTFAAETYNTRYVFADTDKTTFSTEIRADWTFTPDMSLQLYTRPFITSGNFYNYKEFRTPRDYAFTVYGRDSGSIREAGGTYTVDPDAGGPAEAFSFTDRDFNFRSIQGNAVYRWEYRPGATLFLVWQHDRSSFGPQNDFYLSRDFSKLFDTEPTNVFLVKLSYWFAN